MPTCFLNAVWPHNQLDLQKLNSTPSIQVNMDVYDDTVFINNGGQANITAGSSFTIANSSVMVYNRIKGLIGRSTSNDPLPTVTLNFINGITNVGFLRIMLKGDRVNTYDEFSMVTDFPWTSAIFANNTVGGITLYATIASTLGAARNFQEIVGGVNISNTPLLVDVYSPIPLPVSFSTPVDVNVLSPSPLRVDIIGNNGTPITPTDPLPVTDAGGSANVTVTNFDDLILEYRDTWAQKNVPRQNIIGPIGE